MGTGPFRSTYFGTVFLQQTQAISTATSGMDTPNVTAHNCHASSLTSILVHYHSRPCPCCVYDLLCEQ